MKLPFFLARRFVAAETLEGTLPVIKGLHDQRLYIALDLLGEYVRDRDVAAGARDAYVNLVHTVAEQRHDTPDLDVNISIKLSMMGQKIDEAFCIDNLRTLLQAANKHGAFVRLDMEGSDITESTLRIFETVHPDFPDNVGIVLQAYLHRTAEDVARMCALNASVRICKGAYKEPPAIAYQDMNVIRERYVEHMQRLITASRYPGIATHDPRLHEATKRFVTERSIDHDAFEFQMLYGIRPETQLRLVDEGYRMRVYVPFGTEWLPYFSRRLRERKENVWFVLRNMFKR